MHKQLTIRNTDGKRNATLLSCFWHHHGTKESSTWSPKAEYFTLKLLEVLFRKALSVEWPGGLEKALQQQSNPKCSKQCPTKSSIPFPTPQIQKITLGLAQSDSA